jgi:hypothetical protein
MNWCGFGSPVAWRRLQWLATCMRVSCSAGFDPDVFHAIVPPTVGAAAPLISERRWILSSLRSRGCLCVATLPVGQLHRVVLLGARSVASCGSASPVGGGARRAQCFGCNLPARA